MRPPTTPIGRMRHKVTIQAPAYSQSASGEKTQAWSDLASDVAAEIVEASGSEPVAQRRTQAETGIIVTVRWRSGVTRDCRLLLGGTGGDPAGIESAVNADGRKQFLTIVCRRREG